MLKQKVDVFRENRLVYYYNLLVTQLAFHTFVFTNQILLASSNMHSLYDLLSLFYSLSLWLTLLALTILILLTNSSLFY